MAITSLALLPYSKQSILLDQKSKLKILNLLNFLIEKMVLTCEKFYFEKQFQFFDSHVGDTLCQIRAYKTLLLISDAQNKKNKIDQKYKEILKIRDKIKDKINFFCEAINNKKSRLEILDKPETIEDFVNHHDLIFEVAEEDFYLLQNQVLAEFSERSEYQISFKINYHKLSEYLKVGSQTAQRLIRYFQKNLSNVSTEFIKSLVLGASTSVKLASEEVKFLDRLNLKDNHGRSVLPCYEVTKIIFSELLKNVYPVVLIVYRFAKKTSDTHFLIFNPEKDAFIFEQHEKQPILPETPCFFIRGKTVYQDDYPQPIEGFIHRLESVGLNKIILANMAMHPQYSAQEFSSFRDNPYKILPTATEAFPQEILELAAGAERELLEMQDFAKVNGCYLSDPSLFLVKHIFCDIIGNQLPL